VEHLGVPAASRLIALRARRWSASAALLGALGMGLMPATVASAGGPKPVGTMTLVEPPDLAGIAIVAYRWSVTQAAAAGGGGSGAGKAAFAPFQVTKLVDATSPTLLRLTLKGTRVPEVHVDVPLRRGTTATYVLFDSTVTENDRHTAESGGQSLQTLSFQPKAVRETIVTAGGTVSTCWSVVTDDFCD
jgi:type VI protein secretion system component Hcp